MWLLIMFLVTLWAIALLIWLLWKWNPPGDDVHHGAQSLENKL